MKLTQLGGSTIVMATDQKPQRSAGETVAASPIASIGVSQKRGPQAVAPAWHTAVIIAALLGISLYGARTGSLPGIGSHGRSIGYLIAIGYELALLAFIRYGLKSRGVRLADLIGGNWDRPIYVLRDFGIAVAFIAVCGIGVLNGLGYLIKAVDNPAVVNMFPRSGVETVIYLSLALIAGFCEEAIFRGYLLRQFSALSRSTAGGIVLQGVMFGVGHGYQGWKNMLLISVYGTLFGLLAQWRRSLRPGMVAHFLQSGVGGIVNSYFMH
jgi:uncharacterized protein